MENLIDILLLAFLAATAIVMVRMRSLFAAVMLASIYSLLMAAIFVVLDAVDVAFTEAAVGAGISTVLMLGTLALTTNREKEPAHKPLLPLLVVTITGAALIYGTLDFPAFGSPDAPVHSELSSRFIEKSGQEIGIPNIVTSVLASYRGYDTLGETTVIFTAGIGVAFILWRQRRRRKHKGGRKT